MSYRPVWRENALVLKRLEERTRIEPTFCRSFPRFQGNLQTHLRNQNPKFHRRKPVQREAYWRDLGVRSASFDYSHFYTPVVGHAIATGVTSSQFAIDVRSNLESDWRRHLVQTFAGSEEPLLSVIFRENTERLVWEFSDRVSLDEYEQTLIDRRESGWYPAYAWSLEEDGQVVHSAIWFPLHAYVSPNNKQT